MSLHQQRSNTYPQRTQANKKEEKGTQAGNQSQGDIENQPGQLPAAANF